MIKINNFSQTDHNSIGDAMLGDINTILKKLKADTNNIDDIVYRKKIVNKQVIYIVYNEPICSGDMISNFVIRSLNKMDMKDKKINLFNYFLNNIANFKVDKVNKYNDLCDYLHRGFTIILIQGENDALVLETKADLNRSIANPETENTVRGPKDAFVENYQTNIGLIKRRIRSNDLWIKKVFVGKYTNTPIGILSINGVVKPELVDQVYQNIKNIDISGIINSDEIKNLIENENKSVFPTIISSERPDVICNALLEGKVAVMIDNSPYGLVLPALMNDFFKTPEDVYSKSANVSFTRVLKYLTFFIALLAPAFYIALVTYNQEIIPTELLISFAIQRDSVPFPAFVEAFIMIVSFEILRESDLRVPTFTGSSLSIVGALILGEATVNAGIVSPIMIIVIAITAISSLPFSEPELINGLRWYRILFMLGASFLGIIGIVVVFLYFLIKMASLESFGKPYLMPFAPTVVPGLKDSIIRAPLKKLTKRNAYLSNNKVRQRVKNNEK